MPQNVLKRSSFTLKVSQCTSPSQGVVLKRRHFRYALLSGPSKIANRIGSNEQIEDPEENELLLYSEVAPAAKPKSSNLEELTSAPLPMLRVPRKLRMKDQYGHLLANKSRSRAPASVAWLHESPIYHLSGCSKLALSVRELKLETLKLNCRGPVTFSVDYIEITDRVRLEAFELISCKWHRLDKLPALFLQMTDAARWRLREQMVMSTDNRTWDSSQCNQQEKYLIIIFASAPTVLEEATLEEIFTEIGRCKNLSNFFVKITCGKASDRLRSHKHSQKELTLSPFCSTNVQSGVTTISVSDSDDDYNDLIVCPSSNTQLAKTLVIYPPPPAKGGFSITNEDLSCLKEGKYLNDVIIDFYLKYLVCENLQTAVANKCHVFSSFFYKSLTQNDFKEDLDGIDLPIQERRHNRVKTWTKHLDLFKKDFIFVPINQLAHWYLAVICFPGQASHVSIMDTNGAKNKEYAGVFTPSSSFSNPMSLFYRHQTSEQDLHWSATEGKMDDGSCSVSDDDLNDFQYIRTRRYSCQVSDPVNKRPCILLMDSLNCGGKPTVVKVLQEYLEMEWRIRTGSLWSFEKQAMDGWSVQVPQQDNHTDCGIYVLQYVESFIKNPPRAFHPAMDLRDWFPQTVVTRKREMIRQLIFRLREQQAEL